MRLVSDGEWRDVKLGDIAEVNRRLTLNKSIDAYPFISMDKITPFTRRVISEEKVPKKGGSKFQAEDILLARITPCLENGKTSMVYGLSGNEIGIGSTEFITIRAKDNLADQYFLYYLVIGDKFRNYAIQNMTGTSGRRRLPADMVESYKVKVPNLQTQKKIASILSSLDDRIEHNNNLARLLEENAQALYHSWFVRFDPVRAKERGEVPKGINPDQPMEKELADFFPDKIYSDTGLPEGWEEKALSECASFLNGVAAQKYPPENNDFYPVLKIRELRAGGFNASDKASKDVPNKYIVGNGNIIFSWSASLLVDRWFGGKGVLNQHLFLVTPLGDLPEWFVYFTNKNYLEHFQNLAAAKGTTMGHIKRGDLDLAKVVVPSEDILRLAESTIGELYNLSGQLREESVRLTETRDHLLPRLVSGKIDLGAANEESGKV